MPASLREKLKQAFLTLSADTPEGKQVLELQRATRFVLAQAEQYKGVRGGDRSFGRQQDHAAGTAGLRAPAFAGRAGARRCRPLATAAPGAAALARPAHPGVPGAAPAAAPACGDGGAGRALAGMEPVDQPAFAGPSGGHRGAGSRAEPAVCRGRVADAGRACVQDTQPRRVDFTPRPAGRHGTTTARAPRCRPATSPGRCSAPGCPWGLAPVHS